MHFFHFYPLISCKIDIFLTVGAITEDNIFIFLSINTKGERKSLTKMNKIIINNPGL